MLKKKQSIAKTDLHTNVKRETDSLADKLICRQTDGQIDFNSYYLYEQGTDNFKGYKLLFITNAIRVVATKMYNESC